MLRERQIQSLVYTAGQQQTVDLPRDAVYHMIQLQCLAGEVVSTQAAMGTGGTFDAAFPFSLIEELRVIRNGSDVVFQGSGRQLAAEHYYLNTTAPFARLYTVNANVETLRTATVRGVTIPANSDGIMARGGGFTIPNAPASTATVYFDMQVELWFQLGPEDAYFTTLVDARPLATFQLQVRWSATNQVVIPGTGETVAISANFAVMSYDQDNLAINQPFGTFKRSSLTFANLAYGSNQQQILLPRGNFYQGIQIETRAYKASSTVIPAPENAVLGTILNRINTNYQLRQTSFQALQGKNLSDYGGRSSPYQTAQGMPQGSAYLYFPVAGDKAAELIPTFTFDQFDLLLNVQAAGSAQNGATTGATNPIIDLLLEEVIPGVSVSKAAPQGAMAGSIARTSAKPYG